jgi:hypothetical protein
LVSQRAITRRIIAALALARISRRGNRGVHGARAFRVKQVHTSLAPCGNRLVVKTFRSRVRIHPAPSQP